MKRLLPWIAGLATALLLGAAPMLDKLTSANDWLVWGYVCGFVVVVAALAWARLNAPTQPEEAPRSAPDVVDLAAHRERHNRDMRDMRDGQREPCRHADEPRGCWRVRCQLGKACVAPKDEPQ